MVNECSICKLLVKRTAPGLQCSGKCRNFFHSVCANVSMDILSSASSQNIDWFCSTCKSKKRQSIVIQEGNSLGETSTKPIIEAFDMNSFMISIKTDLNDFKKQQADMLTSITFISNSFDDINLKLMKLEVLYGKMDNIIKENTILKKTVYDQSIRLTTLEQAPLSNCVEIIGIPDSAEMEPLDAVAIISKAISFNYNINDVEYCKRMKYAPKDKPKNIVVKKKYI